MAVKDPPALMFLYQLVRISTNIPDPQHSDEAGDAYYSFIGTLVDIDDKYLTLGHVDEDGEMLASAAIRHEDVRLIQMYTSEDVVSTQHENNGSLN